MKDLTELDEESIKFREKMWNKEIKTKEKLNIKFMEMINRISKKYIQDSIDRSQYPKNLKL